MRKRLVMMTALLMAVAACRVDPTPPSVDDAKATWNSINKQSGLTNDLQLVDLKKTDGQFAR